MASVAELRSFEDERGNRIETGLEKDGVNILFKGRGNRLVVHEGAKISGLRVRFDGDGGYVEVGANPNVGAARWALRVSTDSTIIIGRNVTTTGGCFVSALEGTTVRVGDDVMIASEVQIRADDAHAIYDVETKKRANPSGDISVEDHVWLAWGVFVTGGTRIGEGSVIGVRSVVTRSVPNNVVAAGAPAKVVRRNIAWERPHLSLTKPHFRANAENLPRTERYWRMTQDDDPEAAV